MAAPTVVGTPVSGDAAASTSKTINISIPSSGQNLGVCIIAAQEGTNNAVSSLTYNGSTISAAANKAAVQQFPLNFYFVPAPTPGATNVPIVATFAGAATTFVGAWVMQDIVQSIPVDVFERNNAGSGTTFTSASVITGFDSEAMITVIGTGTGGLTLTEGSGQSSIINSLFISNLIGVSVKEKTLAGAVTGSYITGVSTSGDIYIIGLKYVAPSVVASPAPLIQTIQFN